MEEVKTVETVEVEEEDEEKEDSGEDRIFSRGEGAGAGLPGQQPLELPLDARGKLQPITLSDWHATLWGLKAETQQY